MKFGDYEYNSINLPDNVVDLVQSNNGGPDVYDCYMNMWGCCS